MTKLIVKKTDDTTISIENALTQEKNVLPADFKAGGNGNTGVVYIEQRGIIKFLAHFSEIEVDKSGILSSVEETVSELNKFIGNFNDGGSASGENTQKRTVYDVTEHFDVPVGMDLSAWRYKRKTLDDQDLIRIVGNVIATINSDVMIVPDIGFGAYRDGYVARVNTENGSTFANYAIKIDKETASSQGSIVIPNGCKYFDFAYHAKALNDTFRESYYIDSSNVRHEFSMDTTPMNNFHGTASQITINGQNVQKNDIKEIFFGDSYNSVTSIGIGFLQNCTSLTSVDLSVFVNVATIGVNFLLGCTSLTSVDLSVFVNITSIGDRFLQDCTSLTSVDLSVFVNVATIGGYFLQNCTSLTSVDLSVFVKVTSIGVRFLYNCSSLITVDLSVFVNVATIGIGFLYNCTSLTTVDLSGLVNVTSIGANFLRGCNGLTVIKIENLDWIGVLIDIDSMVNVPNVSTSTIYASTFINGNAFKGLFPGLSNWTVAAT